MTPSEYRPCSKVSCYDNGWQRQNGSTLADWLPSDTLAALTSGIQSEVASYVFYRFEQGHVNKIIALEKKYA